MMRDKLVKAISELLAADEKQSEELASVLLEQKLRTQNCEAIIRQFNDRLNAIEGLRQEVTAVSKERLAEARTNLSLDQKTKE